MGQVVSLGRRRPKEALERLNRLTGLEFRHWPESLLSGDTQTARERTATGPTRRG